MITIDKMQEWQKVEQCMSKTVDALGKRIDKGIMPVVIAINVLGISTIASCEGHLNWGASYPWIDIASREVEPIAQRISALIRDGKREDEETQHLMQKVKMLHLQEEMKLLPLLDAFYQYHSFSYDRHLSIWHFARGEARLQSCGAEYQTFRTSDERAEKLTEYQQEMQAFANFLKSRFFGEMNIKQEYLVGEAAGLLGMRHRTLNAHIDRGNIKATRRGRDFYITADELERFKNIPRRPGRPVKV
jgi:excisionase family DNA binding protein